MNTQNYIASGVLELYVAGVLSEKENLEVSGYAEKYPEIKAEIIAIETAILELASKAATISPPPFKSIKHKIDNHEPQVIPMTKDSLNWSQYLGWAASILLAIGLFWVYNQNKVLKSELEIVEQQNNILEEQIKNKNAFKYN